MHSLQQELPSGAEVRKRLDEILTSGEYDSATANGNSSGVMDWIGERIRDLFDGVSGLGAAFPALYWAVLAVLGGILAWVGWRCFASFVGTVRAARSRVPAAGKSGRHDVPEDLLARSLEAAAGGHFTEAVRLCHLAALLGMDRRGLVRYQESLTSGDYRVQLRAHLGARAAFDSLTQVYEPAFFGKLRVGAPEYTECLETAVELVEERAK